MVNYELTYMCLGFKKSIRVKTDTPKKKKHNICQSMASLHRPVSTKAIIEPEPNQAKQPGKNLI